MYIIVLRHLLEQRTLRMGIWCMDVANLISLSISLCSLCCSSSLTSHGCR